jgi:hypothetical protein
MLLASILGLDTGKRFPSNLQFLLLTLQLLSICADRDFIAHMFTSYACVADAVPAIRGKVNMAKYVHDG